MMSTQTQGAASIEVMEGITAAFNRHDVNAILAYFAEGGVMELPRGPHPFGARYSGKEEIRAGLVSRFAGIPNVHYGDGRHWACGDFGVSEWTLTGDTPDGRHLEVRGCDHWTFGSDGLIVKKDSFWKIVE
jgi:ketosteroid isomerase-like protein